MKKVLIIAFYFPPLGGAGVQRTLKFVKYLPEYGWLPAVLSVRPHSVHLLDPSLVEEIPDEVQIHRTKAWLMPSWLPWRIRSFITRWILVVDEQMGWLPFATQEGRKMLQEEKIAALYSTSAPYSAHLVGYRLKQQSGLPWIADFRDAWLGNFGGSYPTKVHDNFTRRLERMVVEAADRVTVVSEPIRQALLRRYPWLEASKVVLLPNGYDPADFQGLSMTDDRRPEIFRITHSGTFYAKNRTPDTFLKAIQKVIDDGAIPRSRILVNFVGNNSKDINRQITDCHLEDIVKTTGYVEHRQSIRSLMDSSLLLLVVGTGPGSEAVMTGKIFEYLAAQKPILALAPAGSASSLIRQSGSGFVVDPEDVPGIAERLVMLYKDWESGQPGIKPDLDVIRSYDRQKLTQTLAELLEEANGFSRRDREN